MTEQGWFVVALLYVGALIAQLHPGAAMGASFGCVFFVFLPDPTVGGRLFKLVRKTGLTVVSWGFGYAVGIAIGGTWAMLTAVLGGALAAAVLGALNLMVLNDGDLPNWLNSVIRAVLRLKTGSKDEH
jgi:hypothetical protein